MTDDKHREAFERWALKHLYHKVDYSVSEFRRAWEAWQAAMRYRDEKEGKV